MRLVASLLLLALSFSCTDSDSDSTSREPPTGGASQDSEPSGIFRDVTESAGIEFRLANGASEARLLIETMTGGVGWIDYDNDGHMDLYLPNGHDSSINGWSEGAQADRLYRNRGDGSFEDVTNAAGLGDRRFSNGVAVADFDNDGDSDLLVTNIGRNTLYRNRGDGTFEDHTVFAGLTAEGSNSSAAWFDLENDGDLDLYITRYVRYRPKLARRCTHTRGGPTVYCHPRLFQGEPDLLYENLGDGRFKDISQAAGITTASATDGKGLGVIAADLDDDGLTDLYVANDTTANFWWRNRGDGRFENRAFEAGIAFDASGRAQAGMGVDVADINGDGSLDIHVTNFSGELNSLLVYDSERRFVDRAEIQGLGPTTSRLGFGTLFGDFDLDTDVDIVVANGHVDDQIESLDPNSGSTYAQAADLWLADGSGKYADGSIQAGPAFEKTHVGRGLASADYDNDGDIDLALATIGGPAILLRNESRRGDSGPAYLRIRLQGTRSNRDGYGARIRVSAGGRTWTHEYNAARSYLSSVDPRWIVGLGKDPGKIRIVVRWPGGDEQVLEDVAPNREIRIVEK